MAETTINEDRNEQAGKRFHMKLWLCLIAAIVVCAMAGGCSSNDENAADSTESTSSEEASDESGEESTTTTYSMKISDANLDIEFVEATENGVTFSVTGTEENTFLDLSDSDIEVDGEAFDVEYSEEDDAYVSELTLLVDGDETTSYQINIEEGETVELTFLYPANPEFDEMEITYDLKVRGPALDQSTTTYEYEDIAIKITKD